MKNENTKVNEKHPEEDNKTDEEKTKDGKIKIDTASFLNKKKEREEESEQRPDKKNNSIFGNFVSETKPLSLQEGGNPFKTSLPTSSLFSKNSEPKKEGEEKNIFQSNGNSIFGNSKPLFGNEEKPKPASLFGFNGPTTTPGLFNNTPIGEGLFGFSKPSTTQSTGGLFMSNKTEKSVGLFGSAPTTGLFGSAPTNSLFGSAPTTGLFGSAPTTGLFGSNIEKPKDEKPKDEKSKDEKPKEEKPKEEKTTESNAQKSSLFSIQEENQSKEHPLIEPKKEEIKPTIQIPVKKEEEAQKQETSKPTLIFPQKQEAKPVLIPQLPQQAQPQPQPQPQASQPQQPISLPSKQKGTCFPIITTPIQEIPAQKKILTFAEAKKEIDDFAVQLGKMEEDIMKKYSISFPELSYETVLPDEIKIKIVEEFFDSKEIKDLLAKINK